jgi:L-threonylcarbamoyladenylate synthase
LEDRKRILLKPNLRIVPEREKQSCRPQFLKHNFESAPFNLQLPDGFSLMETPKLKTKQNRAKPVENASRPLRVLASDTRFLRDCPQGKVLVFPTDTVYGLLGNALDESVVERIYKIKKRDFSKPIPVFVSSLEHAKKIAYISKKQEKFLSKVWPGKVTVVLKKKQSAFRNNKFFQGETIGLRVPDFPLLNKILKSVNFPITGTSANLSGRPASVDFREVFSQLKNAEETADIFVDAGTLPESLPSTVVDLTDSELKILREGAVGKEELIKIFTQD